MHSEESLPVPRTCHLGTRAQRGLAQDGGVAETADAPEVGGDGKEGKHQRPAGPPGGL